MSEENQGSRSPLAIVKLLELGLAITCCYLHFYSFNDGDLVTGFLATGTFCGYVIILSATMADAIVGYLMKAGVNKRINIFYSLLGCTLFAVSGVFIIEAWEQAFRTRTRDLAICKGVVSLINAAIFLLDTIFTYQKK